MHPYVSFSRVAWASDADWESSLDLLSPNFEILTTVTECLSHHPSLLQDSKELRLLRKRRYLIDAIVWIRNALYMLAGGVAVRVSSFHRHIARPMNMNEARSACDGMTRQQHREWLEYLDCVSKSPGKADRVI